MPEQLIPIYTIGYGSRSVADFTAVLRQHHIAYLIDIRSAPYSRYKPEFGKEALQGALQAEGIRYIFMGDTLGGRPSDPSCYIEGKVDYEKVKQTDFYQAGIGRIQTAFQQQHAVVLMCSEGKPETCHRSKLIGATLTQLEIPVAHIDENDEVVGQTAVINRLTGGQLSLFGEHTFTSRKRYEEAEE
ncbi:MAG: DUF488 domain-containing protein [Anaerolineales bacterium]|nr:DUF488 domain-containing protein [Anaerolineales bacterium]